MSVVVKVPPNRRPSQQLLSTCLYLFLYYYVFDDLCKHNILVNFAESGHGEVLNI